ncbi:ABC transporter permease [Candidatus Izimaplasma bacterium ZiA1]|uniref:ABC transporter permease n=1 Tax=Candidatus Izimoplasma sp. ZiA1 TaxID=2024899 RepID=UPI000BAA6412|nr:ABC transporter permease [Candidatus Izimaplasma bacterium ZiA1]
MKKKQININKFIPVFSVLMVLVTWEIVVVLFDIEKYILPRPTNVIMKIVDNFDLVVSHAKYTVFEAIIGILGSVVIAVITAIVLDKVKVIKSFVYPLLTISQTVPLMAIAPLLLIWFGFGVDAKILVVILVCYFPITINIISGFDEIDQDELDLFKVMKASTLNTYIKLKIPYALPYFFSGLKIATTYAVLGALIAEYMGGANGLGIYLIRAMKSFDIEMVFGIIIVIITVTLLLLALVHFIENITIKYKSKGDN